MNDDAISRSAAIDTLNEYFSRIGKLKRLGLSDAEKAISLDTVGAIKSLPSTYRLLEDGTLIVKVPNLSAVHRVIVDAEDSQYCKTFYQDGDDDGV